MKQSHSSPPASDQHSLDFGCEDLLNIACRTFTLRPFNPYFVHASSPIARGLYILLVIFCIVGEAPSHNFERTLTMFVIFRWYIHSLEALIASPHTILTLSEHFAHTRGNYPHRTLKFCQKCYLLLSWGWFMKDSDAPPRSESRRLWRLEVIGRKQRKKKCSYGDLVEKENFWIGTGIRTCYNCLIGYPSGGSVFSPVGRIACTLSLALTRFHVISGLLAFGVGELEWVQKTRADGNFFSAGNGLYTGTQDGRLYLSSIFYSLIEGVILIFRAVYLAVLFLPSILMAPFADTFGVEFRKKWIYLVHITLEQAGPAFIKWGQWAATRPDLFPNDLCTALSELHSKAPAHSFTYSKITIEKAFGRKLYEIFEQFEEVPVASGSIAQVHQASLMFQYPGQRLSKPISVAVKVRHPGVGESIKRDFTIINFFAKLSSYIPALNWLRLDESVRQFAVFMMSQVDLSREAAYLSRFIYNFRRWKDVSFPKPLYPLVHPAVLVETFEPGDSVARYIDDLDGNTRLKRDLAHIGTHALLKMLLVDNFIHADMHPGNILVRVPQRKRSRKRIFRTKPHIIFLDVGMTAELSKSDRRNLLEFFKAVALRDGRTAAECTLRLSRRQSCPDPKAFIE
ncbi:ABC1 family protein C21C3.03, mitochondrial-like, partial [Dendrobium catenatum]|uniref:ABC1 family protein C21C3.03, mitochondrial-like n=1 Tax=Dendrobium catenatum TaxID=906689 RepID=UPI0010A06D04